MAKVVIDVQDDRHGEVYPNAYRPFKPQQSILGGVVKGLLSIFTPPTHNYSRYIQRWGQRVDNGHWIKVWVKEYK